MKFAVAVVALLASVPVVAGGTPVAAPPAAPLSADTTIDALASDPKARAVLDTNFPGLTTHAMYEQFKNMTLSQLQPMSGGKITDEGLAKARAELAAIK